MQSLEQGESFYHFTSILFPFPQALFKFINETDFYFSFSRLFLFTEGCVGEKKGEKSKRYFTAFLVLLNLSF